MRPEKNEARWQMITYDLPRNLILRTLTGAVTTVELLGQISIREILLYQQGAGGLKGLGLGPEPIQEAMAVGMEIMKRLKLMCS